MNRRRITYKGKCYFGAAMVVCMILMWTMMVHADENKQENYYFYYVNANETDLIEKSFIPEDTSMEKFIPEILHKLNDNTDNFSYELPLLPDGVYINSYEIFDTHIRLNFNEAYHDIPRSREVLLRKGLVRLFLQIPELETIDIFVNGESLKDTKGNLVGIMSEDSFLELKGNSSSAYRYDLLTLYFTDETGTKLVPEHRSLYYRKSLSRERVIMEQLIKGPMEAGHYPVLPSNLSVLQIETVGRVGYVNVSSAFVDEALDISSEIPIYAVANSLIAANTMNKVQIWIEGEAELTFGDNMDLYHFYEWNQKLIQEEE